MLSEDSKTQLTCIRASIEVGSSIRYWKYLNGNWEGIPIQGGDESKIKDDSEVYIYIYTLLHIITYYEQSYIIVAKTYINI